MRGGSVNSRAWLVGAVAVIGLRAVGVPGAAGSAEVANVVREVVGLAAAVSVDSTFPGYGSEVLYDGKWIESGEGQTAEGGHPDRLGNRGNTWVSAETEGEHWIRLDWPRPVRINEVHIWWSRGEWWPRAFRIEQWREGRWVALAGAEGWLAAEDRRSVIPLATAEVGTLRVVQAPGGGGMRGFMAAQEVLAFYRPGAPAARSGVRELSAAEVRRLLPRKLERNLARLECPGAAEAVAWLSDGACVAKPGLADGVLEVPVSLEGGAWGPGVRWPVAHVAQGLAVAVAGAVPDAAALVAEVHDGQRWRPIKAAARAQQKAGQPWLVWTFEPVATQAIRVRRAEGSAWPPVSEIEVYRYLPPAKDVWPDRVVKKGGLKDELLAAAEEPSFEALALCGLSMTPARALLGLKDARKEIGVGWEGTVFGAETIRFSFGKDGISLGECGDTVRRRLIDGWRPGTVIEGRIEDLAVRQTALVGRLAGAASRPTLFVRFELRNLGDKGIRTSVQGEVEGGCGKVWFREGALCRGGRAVLVAQAAGHAGQNGRGLQVDVELAPHADGHVDFVCPLEKVEPGPALQPYRTASFGDALAAFRNTWDQILAPASQLEVPEERINRMYRAILAQVFVNGDGDTMPYGSAPSAYEGQLFGVEEGYAMLALAMWGFGRDAQRYMDGTYLTAEFLKKVEQFTTYEHRHQQYRNGLVPHYAVSLYRLTRDRDWVAKHLSLLRRCAEWTIAQRRRTMVLENGQKPLHWGLLPKWSYGGDIADVQCYALYANYCCWRGLVDTAWLLKELGDVASARRYAEEARDYRAAIDRAVAGSYRGDHRLPFLPLRLYAERPDEQLDYYQLFAGCIFDVAAFERGSKAARWIADFLEADNRTFCFLPRFRRDVGVGGLDALYGKGYLLFKLGEDAVKEYLLGFYAYLAFNLDHETFASRETNVIYASDLHVRSRYPVPEMSDPLPCSAAVALQLLRHMLVSEEAAGAGQFSGNLLLLAAAPRRWFADGHKIRLVEAPTHFGPVSLEVHSQVAAGRIYARVIPPNRHPCQNVKLRIRHPEGRPMRSVAVDGRPWPHFDPAGSWVTLPGQGPRLEVVVSY